VEALVSAAKEQDLITIVGTNNVNTSRAAAALGAELVAMEPPELIGGDISVTSADPSIVKETVLQVSKISKDSKVLTGAGVKTREDVEMAIEFGTFGVLLASGVIKAEDPKKVLLSLAKGLQNQ
jgi:triosephosphate isomerase